jgi:probable rRNA maturation factor
MKPLIENRQKKVKLDLRRVRQTINKVQKYLGCQDKEISLLFVDNTTIKEINRQYLRRDYPTNVISFSLEEGDFGHINPQLLGDIVISTEQALEDARKGNLDFDDELDFLLIHGLLHLLGYDHEGSDERQATKMRDKENEIFSKLKGFLIDIP